MAVAELTELAKSGNLDAFEARALEYLGGGKLRLADLVWPFEHIPKPDTPGRISTLVQLVMENSDSAGDPKSALRIVRAALLRDGENADLRKRAEALYRQSYGDTLGFEAALEASGLTSGRPIRTALRVLDMALELKVGDVLMSRAEDTVVEVANIDLERGLFTLRKRGRPTTITTLEIAREYERADPNDFRVLRQLRPDRIAELLENDPVTLVIGLIHSHGDFIDQDTLKGELVPGYMPESQWSKWWTKARTALKKCPNISIEGRSPVIVRYVAVARTLEDETWAALLAQDHPVKWLETLEGYLRQKRVDKEPPSADLLSRAREHMLSQSRAAAARRPGEALACALAAAIIDEKAASGDTTAATAAQKLLRDAPRPGELLLSLPDAGLWPAAIGATLTARPEDGVSVLASLLHGAPAAVLDQLVAECCNRGLAAQVQLAIDTAMADPVRNPEILFWLWKGPAAASGLKLPGDAELLSAILQTLNALGRALNPGDAIMKRFRQRMKSALSLKDYARMRGVIGQIDANQAITMRQQLMRLEGLGENARSAMVDILRSQFPELWRVTETRLQPWEDPTVLYCTRLGIERRTQERDHLVNVTMHENAKRIGEAAALGDLSENAEYKFALEERDMLRARLALLNNELSIAVPIEPADVPTDHVGIGSRVTLRPVGGGEARSFTFFGPFDTDVEQNVINYRAPVGQKMMGLRRGDRTRLMIDGVEIECEVTEIANGLA